jgi:glycosyltransferase involved in cell wall biosynthesis
MKIVFIIDQVYLHGGIERVLSIKANYLASLPDYEIHILTTEQKNTLPCYEFSNAIIFQDLEVNYKRNKSYFHPVNLFKLPRHIYKTKSTIKRIKPDVIIVCSHSVDTYFVPFINKKIPKVKEFHYSKFIEKDKREKPSLFKKLFFKYTDYVESKYDKLIILNKDESKYYKTANTVIIPNPLTFYPDSVSQLTKNRIITAGRIAHVKGYDILIDIWRIINNKQKDWKLDIYGDGDSDYVHKLQNKIDKYGLQDSITLKGATSIIQKEMLNASIFVMTSHNECFPLVLLEAQACGLPIVSFDCPFGPRNIINVENGILIPHYNKKVFADQLLKLMNNKEQLKLKGENARKNSSKYKLETVMNLWEKMFNDLSIK